MQAGAVNIKLMADIADVVNKFKEIEDISKKTANGMSSVFGGISNSFGGFAAKIAGAFSVAAFSVWIKTAINAADVMSDISQRTGVAVKDLAGLQMAFKYGGTSAEAMQTGMVKLSVAVTNGNDALKAMGVQTKNTDGTFKSTRQILGEVADRFKDYEDGAAKTALAVEIFGKSGAELIPVLNAGSKGLDDFDAMARKLGLTIDSETAEQAGRFNDLLDLMGDGFRGVATQVAASLLPTMSGLADQLFTAMTEGDRLKKVADALAIGLKGLYVIGIALVGVFQAVGDTIYAMGKQAMAIMSGDFAGAVKAGNRWSNEIKANWTSSLDAIDKAWNTTGSTAMEAMAGAAASTKKAAPVVNEETKKMAAEAVKLEEQYQKLIHSIEDKTGVMLLEMQGTAKLTEGQKTALKIMQDLQNGTLKLTDEQKQHLTTTLENMLATEEQAEALKELNKTKQAAQTLSDKLKDAQIKETDSLRDGNVKLMQQNETLRIGEAAMRAREIEVLRSTATDLEFAAASVEGNEALAEQARLLRQRADLMEDNTVLEEAKKATDEWKKTSESIESSLTDALMRGFESGKDFGKNLADTLINMFKTLVLRPIIQPIAQGASNVVLSLMGMGASGSAAAGGLSSALTIGGVGLSAIGQSIATGFMTTIGGGSVSAAASAYSAAGMSGVSTGLSVGAGAAAAMPYVAAALVAANALGLMRSTKTVGGGVTGELGGTLQEYDLTRTSGTLFSGPDYNIANKRVSETTEGMNAAFTAIRDKSLAAARALGAYNTGLETFTYTLSDKLHPDLAEIGLVLDGLTDQQKQEKIQGVLMAAEEAMAAIIVGASGLQLAGETAVEALNRLMSIQTASEMLNQFGGAFSAFATSSIEARNNIIELAGGLDQLVQKTQGFIANFYTREEQAGITARGVVQALEAAGFTAAQIAALETKQDFRTLLESIDVSTDVGQKQFVALLDLQAQYANTSTLMEEQGKTLLAIAEAAPQIEVLQKMFETDAEYQARMQTAEEQAQEVFNGLLATMGQVDISINNLTNVMAGRLDRLAVEMTNAQAQANAAAASAIAVANASAQAAIEAAQAAAKAEAAANAATTYDTSASAATGGYISGPTLVGEYGPEIFDPQRSQIYTNAATMSMLGGSDVANEVRALREEVAMMRYETRATATNTAKIAKLQDNWDVRGLTVKTDVDQPLDTVTV